MPGSRIVNNDPGNFRSGSTLSSSRSIEFLTPEWIMEQEFDLTYQDYETEESQDEFSDLEDVATGRTAEIFGIAEPVDELRLNENEGDMQLLPLNTEDPDYAASKQLSIFGTDEVDMDSDEEASIIREIKAEITAQVRNEMQSELAVYRDARERLNSSPENNASEQNNDITDPKLREAIVKMKKLDKILNKKIKREKEVKRDRILLQRRLKEELENMKPEGRDETDKVKTNTEKFLALALPSSHNADADVDEEGENNESEWLAVEYNINSRPATGVSIEGLPDEDERECVTPLFQTQVLEESLTKKRFQASSQSGSDSRQDRSARSAASDNSLGSQSLHSDTSSAKTTDSKGMKKRKNFIERNIQLSSDAGNAIAMTDDEKERIKDLLQDLESLPDIPEEGDAVQEENPYQIAIPLGEGYLPTPEEMTRLEDIDSRLKMLLPPEAYESIASNTPRKIADHEFQMDLFSRTGILDVASDHGQNQDAYPRETALLQAKEHRDLQSRLKEIEGELASLSSAVELEIESPTLSSHQLQELLEECSRTVSRVTAETSTISRSTHRSDDPDRELASVTPLPKEVLQQLLADARQELKGHPCVTASESEGTFITKDDLVLESISEETLRDLLKDSRTTSRYGSRPSSRNLVRSDSYGRLHQKGVIGESPESSHSGDQRGPRDVRRQPFLPEIDPRGQLSTQKINGGLLLENGGQNNFSDSGNNISSITSRNEDQRSRAAGLDDSSEGSPTPHPPTSGRRLNSGGRSRTVSPLKI